MFYYHSFYYEAKSIYEVCGHLGPGLRYQISPYVFIFTTDRLPDVNPP
jgi:hypothetical protein